LGAWRHYPRSARLHTAGIDGDERVVDSEEPGRKEVVDLTGIEPVTS